jgi:hypothetical protein
MVYGSVVVLGLVVGLVIGRWWALAGAAAFGGWIALSTSVDEVPAWFLGVAYAALGTVGIAAGVSMRKLIARR